MATQFNTGDSTRIDYEAVRRAFPLVEEVRGYQRLRREGNRYVGKCPFHDEGRGSFNVYPNTNTFYCYSCSARGDIFDFMKAMDPALKTNRDVLERLMPNGSRVWLTASSTIAPTDVTTEDHEAGGVVLDRHKIQIIHPLEVQANARILQDEGSPRARAAREYAISRRWLVRPEELYGVQPYPVGIGNFREGVLSDYTVLGFRKRVDEQTAFIFGLEEKFNEHEGQLYVGTKMRLTPEAYNAWLKSLRSEAEGEEIDGVNGWLAKAGYTNCIPGSVDYNYNAPVLVICEGPGDGVRLFHEAHRTRELAELFGRKVHITYADSARCLTEASLPRRASPSGKAPVSFFSGYTSVVLLYDHDLPDRKGRKAGREGAAVVKSLIHQQVPGTPVRDVLLHEGYDLSEFFDRNGTILGLIDLIKQTTPVR